jgi:hypothetical protein
MYGSEGTGRLSSTSCGLPRLLEVGYSLTRKRRERGSRREELSRFGRIPSLKATLIWLAARYAFVEQPILVVTEGLGQRRYHGRGVLLVNEHTASAREMVSAFKEENNLATIVGNEDAWPSPERQRIQGWSWIHSRPAGCRLPDMARMYAGEQRYHPKVPDRTFAGCSEREEGIRSSEPQSKLRKLCNKMPLLESQI